MADKLNRNDPCHCGSGKKYKNCCQSKDSSPLTSKIGIIAATLAMILGLLFITLTIFGGSDSRDCPPGTNWSEAHQHCH